MSDTSFSEFFDPNTLNDANLDALLLNPDMYRETALQYPPSHVESSDDEPDKQREVVSDSLAKNSRQLLHAHLYNYLLQNGYTEAAVTLLNEAKVPHAPKKPSSQKGDQYGEIIREYSVTRNTEAEVKKETGGDNEHSEPLETNMVMYSPDTFLLEWWQLLWDMQSSVNHQMGETVVVPKAGKAPNMGLNINMPLPGTPLLKPEITEDQKTQPQLRKQMRMQHLRMQTQLLLPVASGSVPSSLAPKTSITGVQSPPGSHQPAKSISTPTQILGGTSNTSKPDWSENPETRMSTPSVNPANYTTQQQQQLLLQQQFLQYQGKPEGALPTNQMNAYLMQQKQQQMQQQMQQQLLSQQFQQQQRQLAAQGKISLPLANLTPQQLQQLQMQQNSTGSQHQMSQAMVNRGLMQQQMNLQQRQM
ncbi:hypothetical protein BABINDRAFT_160837 [Babjeviella inositovora NRRL Y-12698]|uniref:Uncharacterized protein n=1 Tax=Babjeviella inositovora NRRL Y-12698 TaxID=984486 RepID=A0A1E3QS95_9ASCO|nr:uncharacterized protein BABINDRAFT_160837 [Babjeviella inositovora NRRL Y-12698]ODQ80575.1 hypothetical protein BABINDRAFT_160837 [Babjeviella inositovora NRRL Y-12698]